jgi:DNA-binding CsgD family transcriptional regulator
MTVLTDRHLIELIGKVYEAAIDASRWSDVAKLLGITFHARFSSVFGFEPNSARVLYSHSWGMPGEFFVAYEATYAALDLRMPAALRASTGTVVTDESLIDLKTYRSSAIYNEYLRPNECDHLMAVLPENSADTRVIVSLNRSSGAGAFTDHERMFFGRLVPHLQRAISMSARIVTATGADRLSQELMHRATFGIITLNTDGKILDVNPIARGLLRKGDTLYQSNGCLVAVQRSANSQLQRAIANVARLQVNRTNCPVTPVLISQPDGLPLRLMLAPLVPRSPALNITAPCIVAFVFAKNAGPSINSSSLSLVYGLTPAEARVAAKLAEGYTLASIADLYSISIETVRTHLKRALAKADCNSQTELVREVLLGPALSMSPNDIA